MDPAKSYGRHFNPAKYPTVKLSLHLPDSILRAVDSTRGNVTRMEWIRQAIRERLTTLAEVEK